MNGVDLCYEKSIDALKECSSPHGLFASGPPHGYNTVWSRDSMISFLGASLLSDFKKQFVLTIKTLSKYQSKLGQIPNCVDLYDKKRKKQVTYTTIDSTLWYIIGHHIYAKNYDDNLLKKYKKNIDKALTWVDYQDTSEDSLPEQQPTSDWQDIFPHKYGQVLNTQALYYKTLILLKKEKLAKKIKKIVNGGVSKELNFFDSKKGYYLPWLWKAHDKYREQGNWFDSLANLLTVVFGLADKNRAMRVLSFIKKNKITKPYPIMSIYPPIKRNQKAWKDYFNSCDLNPYQYANAGIWPYIGSFYVIALVKYKKFNEAKKQLTKLAESNLKGNFPEWIHPKTRKSFGHLQAWDAGTYMLAYECLKAKKVLNI